MSGLSWCRRRASGLKCLDHLLGDINARTGPHCILEDDVVFLALGDFLHHPIGTLQTALQFFIAALIDVIAEFALLALELAIGFVEIALELAPEVRVNCVLPTSTDTNLLRSIPGADEDWVAARYARNAESLPMKRLGTGDDVAGAIAFLSSTDASFITGVALPVDGGRSAGGA